MRNTLILIFGMLVGIAVIGQPIAKNYIDAAVCCKIKQDDKADDTDSTENPEVISSLEAVAPATQFQVVTMDYQTLDAQITFEGLNRAFSYEFVEELSQKLLKVLFNYIIAPNAP
ncbi:hypothetical protein N6H18_03245 [Reichenbachiella agarivorans]|uniref:Uncharacterized protein n=1 Tax=Reichenbachiella agarivorans TaxID=2979464 RepID=A0ABY6CXM0_9BACT|nr:hypothetical protein [Reichenbachiella agarivorans]UXP32970.1 hypothetical protein N6H18_03245 [Reichenbachiella agarivorans]